MGNFDGNSRFNSKIAELFIFPHLFLPRVHLSATCLAEKMGALGFSQTHAQVGQILGQILGAMYPPQKKVLKNFSFTSLQFNMN